MQAFIEQPNGNYIQNPELTQTKQKEKKGNHTMARKFSTPKTAYTNIVQSATTKEVSEKRKPYRFNMNFSPELHDYLQEMSWRNRITITEYLNRLVLADMEKHPEWTETVDVLNGSK